MSKASADCGRPIGRLPVGGALELVGVGRRDALGREEVGEGRPDLDLPGHEGVVLARRPRVGRQLLLDDDLDDLAAMGDGVDAVHGGGRHDDDAVLVADDGVPRAHGDAAARDDAVALPGLHHRRALARRRGEGKDGEAVLQQLVCVAHAAVRDEAADGQLLQAQELDVAADGLPGAARRHDEHVPGAAQLKSLVLRRGHAGRLVRLDVGSLRDKVKRDSPTAALLPRRQAARALDVRRRPALQRI
mmetsp:Transcript_17405/g.61866  ORF Transcript_17405/g.61866 Transcript_17405/m.61866 type:complete len:246 (+) Transcript_17405:290-1027(+)